MNEAWDTPILVFSGHPGGTNGSTVCRRDWVPCWVEEDPLEVGKAARSLLHSCLENLWTEQPEAAIHRVTRVKQLSETCMHTYTWRVYIYIINIHECLNFRTLKGHIDQGKPLVKQFQPQH